MMLLEPLVNHCVEPAMRRTSSARAQPLIAEPGKLQANTPRKKRIILSVDADVLAWFRNRNGDYKTAINDALRAHCKGHGSDIASDS